MGNLIKKVYYLKYKKQDIERIIIMSEKAKRLAPTNDVVRELYLKSGNQCAFPGCYNIMVDETGNFIGQICHIEAAEEGGERFNPNMTNEERRAFDNLMLMCYEHHIVTNDVIEYPVSKLKKMKKDHEDKFSGVIQKMQNSIVDYGVAVNFSESKVCQALSDRLGYGCSNIENSDNSRILNKLLSNLIDLPIETRFLLSIMVSRSFENKWGSCSVPLHEIESATGKDSSYILQQIDILKRRNLISEPEIDEYNCSFCILFGDCETGWNYWNDIREYCKKSNIPTNNIFVNLDFSLFD